MTTESSGVEIPLCPPAPMEPRKMHWHHLPMVLILLTATVIAVGGTIRIYDAGESCPDWPLCFGTWGFDISEEEQGLWWDEHPDEIDSRGADHRYTVFKFLLNGFIGHWQVLYLAPWLFFNS